MKELWTRFKSLTGYKGQDIATNMKNTREICGKARNVVGLLLRKRGCGEMTAIELIAAECQRKREEEGWNLERNCMIHTTGELSMAAACYALPRRRRDYEDSYDIITKEFIRVPKNWPWNHSCWKPTPGDRIRELVKAGALICAEIDRLRALGGSSDGR